MTRQDRRHIIRSHPGLECAEIFKALKEWRAKGAVINENVAVLRLKKPLDYSIAFC